MNAFAVVLLCTAIVEIAVAHRRFGGYRDGGMRSSSSSEGEGDFEGFGPLRDGRRRHHGPPKNMTDCISRMSKKWEHKMEMKKKFWEKKHSCMDKCAEPKQKKCFEDAKKVMEGMKAEFEAAQKKIIESAKSARDCLVQMKEEDKSKPLKDRRCSESAINFGRCGKKIIKSMVPMKTKFCVKRCMWKSENSTSSESSQEEEEEEEGEAADDADNAVDLEEAAEDNDDGDDDEEDTSSSSSSSSEEGRGGWGRRGRGPGRRHGRGGRGRHHHGGRGRHHGRRGRKGGRHMCLKRFCKHSALKTCGDQAGMEEAFKAKRELKEKLHTQLDALFPKMCSCMKEAAKEIGFKLPKFLEDANCDDLPDEEVCQEARHHRMRSESSESGEDMEDSMEEKTDKTEEPVLSIRQKREVENLWNAVDEFDLED